MTRKLEAALIGVGAAVIAAGLIFYFRPGPPAPAEQIGAGKEIERIYTPVYLKAAADHTRDTLRLTVWKTRYDTVRTVERITDTVWVKEFVRVSDSTVKACTEAVDSCARVRAALEELNRGLRLQLEGTQRQVSAAKRQGLLRTAGGFVAGYATGEIIDFVRKPP